MRVQITPLASLGIVTALLSISAFSGSAYAQDEDNDGDAAAADAADGSAFVRIEERTPRDGTPLIANKLYPMSGRFELGATFDVSFGDKYVDHIGGHANVAYHIFDFLALEGYGGYLYGDETGIVKNVRLDGKSAGIFRQGGQCGNATCEPQLPDMWATTWFAGANVQWAPIYGKISAVSEYDLNFQLYLRGGGGVEGITRKLSDNTFDAPGIRPSGNLGIGVRLIPWKYIAIRAEFVQSLGLNPNVEEHDANDEGICSDGYVLREGLQNNCKPDLSSSTTFQVGISFLL